jgi:hypothetical protein
MKKMVLGAVTACAGGPLVALAIGSAVASATPPSGAGTSLDLFGSSVSAPIPNALAAALVSTDSQQPLVGPGGSIIGNGIDADRTAPRHATVATAVSCLAMAAPARTAARAATPG